MLDKGQCIFGAWYLKFLLDLLQLLDDVKLLRTFPQALSTGIALSCISGIPHDSSNILIIVYEGLVYESLVSEQVFFIVDFHAFRNVYPLWARHAVAASGTVDFEGIPHDPLYKLDCFHLLKAQ